MPLTDDELRVMSLEQLLEKGVEEAAELIHAIQKFKLHGPTGTAPNGTEYDNTETMMHEARQVSDVMRIVGGKMGINWGWLKEELNQKAKQQLAAGERPRLGDTGQGK